MKPKKKRQIVSRYVINHEFEKRAKQRGNEEHYFDLIDKEVKPTDADLTIFNPEQEADELIDRLSEIEELNFDHDR